MSRQHKITIVAFCIGILLCGVGVGVTFAEFSAFTYGGRHVLGETDMRTENYDVEFVPKKDRQTYIVGARAAYTAGLWEISTDAAIPLNTVRFCVTYNGKRMEPFVTLEEAVGEETTDRIEFSWIWKNGTDDEAAFMMEAKDLFLQNLKEGKIVTFDTVDVEDVTVLVNPKNAEDVRIIY